MLAGASATDRHFDFTGVVVNGIEALEVSGPGSISDPVTVTLSPFNFTISAIQHVTLSVETIFVFETDVVELFNVVFDGTATALSSTLITGIAGNDVLAGGSLSDVITGGSAVDVMTGAGGNDIFRFTSGADIVAGEYIDGGDDIDTLELPAVRSCWSIS